MKRWMMRAGLAVLLLAGAVGGLERFAAESGEVVVLHAREADGHVVQTRLWVVDAGGEAYLRVGADGSGWFSRLTANPEVEVLRGDTLTPYLAIPAAEQSADVNRLMAEKYGWRDVLIGALVGGREGSIPVHLQPR